MKEKGCSDDMYKSAENWNDADLDFRKIIQQELEEWTEITRRLCQILLGKSLRRDLWDGGQCQY